MPSWGTWFFRNTSLPSFPPAGFLRYSFPQHVVSWLIVSLFCVKQYRLGLGNTKGEFISWLMTTFLPSSKGLQLFSHFKFLCFVYLFLVNLRSFLHRERIQRWSRDIKKGNKVDLSRICSHRESGQTGEVLLPWVSLASQLGAYRWRGGIVTGKEGCGGLCSLIFIPAPVSQEEEEFFPYLA